MITDNLRAMVWGATAVYLIVGYAASQWLYFQGQATRWAETMNSPAISGLSAVLLPGCIALAFIRREPEA